MTTETTLIVLFSIATAVAMVVRRLRFPYTVALVLVGLVLGGMHVVAPPHLTKELLFAVLLPGLLFEAAFHLDSAEFWRNKLAISALAVPGVIAAIVLTGLVTTAAIALLGLDAGFSWRYGIVFGALIAATDPIAVVSLFRHLNAPGRLRTLVEGESLLNDGTSVVLLTLILSFVAGENASASGLVLEFIRIVGGGAMMGLAIGYVASQVTKRVDDAMIEITLTTIAAYGSFALAEEVHVSGVIAAVAAGMVCGNYARRVGMSPTTRIAVESFWEYIAFALNSVVFLLIGFEVDLAILASSWQEITIAYLAVLASRAGVIAATTLVLRRTRERIPVAWSLVITWGGLRGALSMVLALALALDFPHRALLVTMTFGVVLLSLLVQGISMPLLLTRLGLVDTTSNKVDYDRARVSLRVAESGLAEVDRMSARHETPPIVLAAFREQYEARRARARDALASIHLEQRELARDASVRAVRHLLAIEQAELQDAVEHGMLRRDLLRTLRADLDARLLRLDAGDYEDPIVLLRERDSAPADVKAAPPDAPAAAEP